MDVKTFERVEPQFEYNSFISCAPIEGSHRFNREASCRSVLHCRPAGRTVAHSLVVKSPLNGLALVRNGQNYDVWSIVQLTAEEVREVPDSLVNGERITWVDLALGVGVTATASNPIVCHDSPITGDDVHQSETVVHEFQLDSLTNVVHKLAGELHGVGGADDPIISRVADNRDFQVEGGAHYDFIALQGDLSRGAEVSDSAERCFDAPISGLDQRSLVREVPYEPAERSAPSYWNHHTSGATEFSQPR